MPNSGWGSWPPSRERFLLYSCFRNSIKLHLTFSSRPASGESCSLVSGQLFGSVRRGLGAAAAHASANVPGERRNALLFGVGFDLCPVALMSR